MRHHRSREEITRIFNRLNRLERRALRLRANLLFMFRVVAWASPGLSNLWCPLEYTLLPYSAGLKAEYWQLSQWFGRRQCVLSELEDAEAVHLLKASVCFKGRAAPNDALCSTHWKQHHESE